MKMKRRQRLRAITKWGGLTLCVLLFALWLASGWWLVALPPSWQFNGPLLLVEAGRVHLETPMYVREPDGLTSEEFQRREADMQHRSLQTDFALMGWTSWPGDFADQFLVTTSEPIERSRIKYWYLWDWGFQGDPARHRMWFTFPLWLPFLLLAIHTGYLFWSDHRRRTRVGCCRKCGYSITGNTSGTCPECGEVMTPAKAAPS